MSATEELRRMLDERGVEWTESDSKYVKETCWPFMGELTAMFVEFDNGETRFSCDHWCFTPEQAIAATLGGGECEMVTSGTPCDGNTDKACTSCGAYNIGEYYDGNSHIAVAKFCPECGKAVKR